MQPGSQDKGQSLNYPDVKGCYQAEGIDDFKKARQSRSRADLRDNVFKRDKFKCAKCRKTFYTKEYVSDFFDKGNAKTDGRNIFGFSKDEHGDFFLVGLPSELVADHIQPICLGGDEWNINNIQTLCLKCNSIKTAYDISRARLLKKAENGKELSREIGRRIRQLRGYGMTQKEMGKKLGIIQGRVSRLERGESLTVELILKISEKFGKTTDWILKGE